MNAADKRFLRNTIKKYIKEWNIMEEHVDVDQTLEAIDKDLEFSESNLLLIKSALNNLRFTTNEQIDRIFTRLKNDNN